MNDDESIVQIERDAMDLARLIYDIYIEKKVREDDTHDT